MAIYMKSDALNMDIKYLEDSDSVVVNDKKKCGSPGMVTYSHEEVEVLREINGGITKQIHQIKNIFDGTLLKVEGGINER